MKKKEHVNSISQPARMHIYPGECEISRLLRAALPPLTPAASTGTPAAPKACILLLLSLLTTGCLSPQALSESACGLTVTVQSQTRSAQKTKCGTPGGCAESIPPKFFMKLHIDARHSYIYSDAQTQNSCSLNTTQINSWDPQSCSSSSLFTGSAAMTSSADPQINCTATQLPNSDWDNHPCASQIILFLTDMLDEAAYQTIRCTTHSEQIQFHHSDQSQSSTTELDSLISWSWSDEYTDEMLRQALIALIPPFAGPLTDATSSAFYSMDANHYQAQGQKMRYRLKLSGAQAGTTYKLAWQELTVYPDGTSKADSFQEYLTAPGPEAFTTEHYIDPPCWEGRGLAEGTAKTTVENIAQPQVVSSTANGDGGSSSDSGGAGPEPGSGGVCGTGSSDLATPNTGPIICVMPPCRPKQDPCNGLTLTLSMGTAAFGTPAGDIYLSAQAISPELAQPSALRFSGTSPDVEVIKTNGVLRQIKAPQALAHIEPINQFKYDIRFYRLSELGPRIAGAYHIPNPTNWFVKWTIENPAQSTSSFNTLKITQSRPGQSKSFHYNYDPQTDSWSINHPDNLRQDRWQVVHDPTTQTRLYIAAVGSPNGPDVLKTTAKYQSSNGAKPWSKPPQATPTASVSPPSSTTQPPLRPDLHQTAPDSHSSSSSLTPAPGNVTILTTPPADR